MAVCLLLVVMTLLATGGAMWVGGTDKAMYSNSSAKVYGQR
jgi:hypothetical protein